MPALCRYRRPVVTSISYRYHVIFTHVIDGDLVLANRRRFTALFLCKNELMLPFRIHSDTVQNKDVVVDMPRKGTTFG
jgi:hypothetical protein